MEERGDEDGADECRTDETTGTEDGIEEIGAELTGLEDGLDDGGTDDTIGAEEKPSDE
jgi:hypothetical protein